jgi:gamma-glutamyltranspeptidase/glutathione hydrolase
VIVEAERRAYADRNYFLGDPVKMPLNALMDDNYLKQRMANFSLTRQPHLQISKKGTYNNESMETTHYSIVDQNAIAATTTLNAGYGSKYYCDDLGFY